MQCVILDWSSDTKRTLGEKTMKSNKVCANDNFLVLVNVTVIWDANIRRSLLKSM